ncbi:protein translocase subunit SecF [SAR202 cluster bacterium AD-802-E10_MRT_200m]|nr:protein translocase subunit SecF [SAR202 cluster bacterium AD-802-E10_MRT_200m]
MDFVGHRNWFFIFSTLLIVAGLISIAMPQGFKAGIEFTGGSALTISYTEPVSQSDVRKVLSSPELQHEEAIIQGLGKNSYLVRTTTLLEEAPRNNSGVVIGPSEREKVETALEQLAPFSTSPDIAAVSAVVAQETVRNAIFAVVIASLAITLYISWAFRLVPNSFRMGTTAIIAAIHDVLIVVGIFSILGRLLNIEINAMFITGILTVVGYSVHDTIVVFDRIRENTAKRVSRDLSTIINVSIMETLGRSLTTSLTTIFVIVAIVILGGGSIQSLLITLMIGIITGTYSSIGIASQLLITWERGDLPLPFRKRKQDESLPA